MYEDTQTAVQGSASLLQSATEARHRLHNHLHELRQVNRRLRGPVPETVNKTPERAPRESEDCLTGIISDLHTLLSQIEAEEKVMLAVTTPATPQAAAGTAVGR